MIAVAVIGILAAMVVPGFYSHAEDAETAAATNNLRILRGAIQLYAARHGDIPPSCLGDDATRSPGGAVFNLQLTKLNHYMPKMPRNPFNELTTVRITPDGEDFPPGATGFFAWVYKPATVQICLARPGMDKDGLRYCHY